MNKTMIESPCMLVCTMDIRSGFCLGCARTLDEISRWSGMSDAERQAVMMQLPVRHQELEKREG
ncbi:DUF1289 domain-containing protein [Ochrobactrum sp. CM-21-5]|nr:DUF1289 domain-containing protein [Ochrobactrum sp. CM-21-5]MBC2884996.1 DUF1289 domain-containing protein [Ochrobactrum sp. CM-21-5]